MASFTTNDYISKIINETESKIIFVEDNNYEDIKGGIDESNVETIVMISLADSLKNRNAFIDLELKPEIYVSKVENYKNQNKSIISQEEFVVLGENYDGEVIISTDLDTEFLITYTSGSTNEKRPKAIIHNTRSFNTIGRFHDKELNGGKSIKPLTLLAIIPTYSNSNLISCISDALMQGAKLAFEPYYHPNQFLHALIMYKPHYVAATKSFWLNFSKKILFDENYRDVKQKNLFLAFSCGEPFEINEENLMNKALKQAKMGMNVIRIPFPIVRMSEAGGDCEHGSIFFTLFRSYKNLKIKNKLQGEAEGLSPFKFCDVAVLDEEGNYLPPYELGRLVANSPCTMKGYKNNPEATDSFFITDATGKVWGDMNVYGYKDKSGKVYIRGRIPKEGESIPPFTIAKQILKDRKNVLSCEVVRDDAIGVYVAHVEFNPMISKDPSDILQKAQKRCEKILNEHDIELCFRIRDFEESFPLTGSGKRDVMALKKEGVTEKCVVPIEKNGECSLIIFKIND